MSLPQLDLVFACDCTSSMSSYIAQCQAKIKEVAQEIMAVEKCDVRYALVSYRDHPPQDTSYITQVSDFTPSVSAMKGYVDQMSAQGGGDGPEAVGQALHDLLKLSWRKECTRVCIFIADAPPHGLGNSGDGFPDGIGPDPIETTHELAKLGISVYSVAVEPNLGHYEQGRSFFKFVSDTTGGRYITLGSAHLLPKLIVGGVIEQLSMDKLLAEVEEERKKIEEERGPGAKIDDAEWTSRVHSKMTERGVHTYQLKCDMQAEIPAEAVEAYTSSKSLEEVRKKAPKPTATSSAEDSYGRGRGGRYMEVDHLSERLESTSVSFRSRPAEPTGWFASLKSMIFGPPPTPTSDERSYAKAYDEGEVVPTSASISHSSAASYSASPSYAEQKVESPSEVISYAQVERLVKKSKSVK